MNKVNIERVNNLTPEQVVKREKEIIDFVKKDYQEHRSMMDKLAEGFESKEPEILIMDRSTIEKYLRSVEFYGFIDANTYIISYYGAGESKVNFDQCRGRVCQLFMDDIRFVENQEEFYKQHQKEFNIIAKFIIEAVSCGNKIICQCNAGVSRSAATAKGIKEYFYGTGSEIDVDGSYIPNDLFYNCILKALDEI